MQSTGKATDVLMEITSRPDLVFTNGQGSWLYDSEGKKYLDLLQGWAVNCLGHCPPEIVEAVTKQSQTLLSPSAAFYNQPSIDLAKRLTDASCFDEVFFANCGAEANEGAVKLARKWGQKHKNAAYKIITFNNAFHGRTIAMMSASGKPGWDSKFPPQVDGFPKAEYNDIDSVKKLIDDQTVAVMLEPIQGEAGAIPAEREFMQALRQLTQENNMLLIVDEVQSGMGRCGALFAHQLFDIDADIMTLAKGIGGGAPLAALLSTRAVSCFEHGDQGGTYNGNPLMTAVGIAVFDALTAPGFMDQVNARAKQLSEGLLQLSSKYGFEGERGLGLLRSLKLGTPISGEIVEKARSRQPEGLLLNNPRPDLLRFMPALNIPEEDLATGLQWLDAILDEMKA